MTLNLNLDVCGVKTTFKDFPLVRSFLWLLFYWCILQKTASKKFTLFQIFDFSLKCSRVFRENEIEFTELSLKSK